MYILAFSFYLEIHLIGVFKCFLNCVSSAHSLTTVESFTTTNAIESTAYMTREIFMQIQDPVHLVIFEELTSSNFTK